MKLGREWNMDGRERALYRYFASVLALIELQTHRIAALTMKHLGYSPIAFVDSAIRISIKFPVAPEARYPTVQMRKKVVVGVTPSPTFKPVL